ncbi:TIM barrel protein [Nocardia sp. NEAU-G5]|uniref:TIM barrel protein n=1 Tax=Nocardia albiluteola TaxID=2842303 RepID=A0ABS6AZL2_9NOCA|nr:TIM barrel protein [Nocardia albiluteola]MBU3062636.1 TIM barrel protein [Nocardia albiluteola]MBU3065530.1 TIM barrel protein [Nocardia albiluteola]
MTQPLPYAVNLSILFTELPLLERPAAAKAAGFDAVEFWWPFGANATPADDEVEAFVTAIEQAGVQLIGLNLFAGDMPAGERGLVSWPGREQEFADSVAVAVAIGRRLGCKAFNALYGLRLEGQEPGAQDEVAIRNLALAARSIGEIGGTVLLEPVSGIATYPLKTAEDVVGVLDRVREAQGATNIGLLADIYHLTVNGDDLDKVIEAHADRIAHVQFADAPGRHEPGTGELDIFGYIDKIGAAGYRGYVAAEYAPSGASADSFAWLPAAR